MEDQSGQLEHISKHLSERIEKPQTSSDAPASSDEYKCPVCKDAGIVHATKEDGATNFGSVVPCSCCEEEVRKSRAEGLMRYCQLPARTENKTFETFEERTPKCKAAKEMAYRLAQGDEDVIFLTMMSDTGFGKSHLCIAICREWLKRGLPAKYCFVPELLDEIRNSYRKDESTGLSHCRLLDVLASVALLVLDDLGTEKKSDWACETLQTIIDRRARSALPLVVTTNKALDQLPNDDEGRIASRLQRETWCKVVLI